MAISPSLTYSLPPYVFAGFLKNPFSQCLISAWSAFLTGPFSASRSVSQAAHRKKG